MINCIHCKLSNNVHRSAYAAVKLIMFIIFENQIIEICNLFLSSDIYIYIFSRITWNYLNVPSEPTTIVVSFIMVVVDTKHAWTTI